MLYRIKGAILIGIFLTSIISWPRPTAVTYFPHTDAGDELFDFFKKVVTFHPIGSIGNAIDVSAVVLVWSGAELTLAGSTTMEMVEFGTR